MKNLKLKLKYMSLAVIAFFTLFACDNQTEGEEAKAEIKEAVETTSNWVNEEAIGLRTEIEEAQIKIDKKLTGLEKKWIYASTEAKEDIEEEIDELKESRSQLEKNLERFDDQVEDGWTTFKANVKETLKEVNENLEEMDEEV